MHQDIVEHLSYQTPQIKDHRKDKILIPTGLVNTFYLWERKPLH